VLEFAILFLLVAGLLMQTTRLSATGAARIALVISVAYAGIDEWRQTFVRGRDGNLRDVIIDAAGALIAMALFQMWARRRRRSDSLATTSLANKWRA
jgi:VanZ family protein